MTDDPDKDLLEKTASKTARKASTSRALKDEASGQAEKSTTGSKTSTARKTSTTSSTKADPKITGDDGTMNVDSVSTDTTKDQTRNRPDRSKAPNDPEAADSSRNIESEQDAPSARSDDRPRRPRPRYDRKNERTDHKYFARKKFKPRQPYQKQKKKKNYRSTGRYNYYDQDIESDITVGNLPELEICKDFKALEVSAKQLSGGGEPILLNSLFEAPLLQLGDEARAIGVETETAPNRTALLNEVMRLGIERKVALRVKGLLELKEEGYGLIVYQHENYRIRPFSAFVPEVVIKQFGLLRGQIIEAQIHPHNENGTTPYVLHIESVMDRKPAMNLKVEPFEDLIPYYPLERFLLETNSDVPWDNLSMRIVDLLTPVGFGQRGLIVAAPRTGKTVLQQCIARAIQTNNPEVHLIVLLIDERPEEVTDFRRQVTGEVVSSTFDESPASHVHAAEMVIEKARRMVEVGEHVVILLDSITRLARAYNALMPSSGKILSGGIEANALQKPKRFFGSARNIEGGGSLTILGTALVETGSRMDEVIFEEFKGTGNMELHLDRALVDKRIFPSISIDKSGTRKEELLYHPEELNKIYSLRRAMKGVPSTEGMEMLIQRVRKTKTNAEFLMGINR